VSLHHRLAVVTTPRVRVLRLSCVVVRMNVEEVGQWLGSVVGGSMAVR
jgi:hypothetical protein